VNIKLKKKYVRHCKVQYEFKKFKKQFYKIDLCPYKLKSLSDLQLQSRGTSKLSLQMFAVWGSAVGIVTGYGFDGSRIELRWGQYFPQSSRTAVDAISERSGLWC
jgi:hypothetical protein